MWQREHFNLSIFTQSSKWIYIYLEGHPNCMSYGDIAEWVDFAYWWSCIGKGLRLEPAQQACKWLYYIKNKYWFGIQHNFPESFAWKPISYTCGHNRSSASPWWPSCWPGTPHLDIQPWTWPEPEYLFTMQPSNPVMVDYCVRGCVILDVASQLHSYMDFSIYYHLFWNTLCIYNIMKRWNYDEIGKAVLLTFRYHRTSLLMQPHQQAIFTPSVKWQYLSNHWWDFDAFRYLERPWSL